MTEQAFQTIDVTNSAVQCNEHSAGTVQESDCTVQGDSTLYNVEQLKTILGCERRTIFHYAKTILKVWHWEPETVFKPVFGKYSQRALDEMKRLKELGADVYALNTCQKEEKPSTTATGITGGLSKASGLISSDGSSLERYESRLSQVEIVALTEVTEALELLETNRKKDEVRRKRIAATEKSAKEARLARIKARALKRAAEEYELEKELTEEYLAELRLNDV